MSLWTKLLRIETQAEEYGDTVVVCGDRRITLNDLEKLEQCRLFGIYHRRRIADDARQCEQILGVIGGNDEYAKDVAADIVLSGVTPMETIRKLKRYYEIQNQPVGKACSGQQRTSCRDA